MRKHGPALWVSLASEGLIWVFIFSDRFYWNTSFRLLLHFFPLILVLPHHLHHPPQVVVLSIKQQLAMLGRKSLDLKASPIFVGTRGEGNSVTLCVPVCIYEWLSLRTMLLHWRTDFDMGGGGDGGGEGSLFPTVGAWYREWQEVLLATGWCDACLSEGRLL